MTTVTILPELSEQNGVAYRAVSGKIQAVGRSAGEALDALTPQLDEEESGTLVIVQNLRADRFFSAQQQQRLTELMARWRAARDTQSALPPDEQAELEALTEAEIEAAAQRAKAMLDALAP
jgi:hypothetical protein